jgi:ABC-2 type transport system permease protein
MFLSALCNNQITAATITFGAFFLMFILGYIGDEMPEQYPALESWPEDTRAAAAATYALFRGVLTHFPVESHATELAEGIFQPADVAYYVFFVGFFLFLTFRALEARRWGS